MDFSFLFDRLVCSKFVWSHCKAEEENISQKLIEWTKLNVLGKNLAKFRLFFIF